MQYAENRMELDRVRVSMIIKEIPTKDADQSVLLARIVLLTVLVSAENAWILVLAPVVLRPHVK